MKKLYMLDTSVLMRNSNCFYVFDDNDVAIAEITLEELDSLKEAPGDKGYYARRAIKEIFNIKENGYKLPSGGEFKIIDGVSSQDIRNLDVQWTPTKNDNIIIYTAQKNGAILVTSDTSMLLKANAIGIDAQIFYNEQVSESALQYTGHSELVLSDDEIQEFCTTGACDLLSDDLYENEFLTLTTDAGGFVDLAMYKNCCVEKLNRYYQKPCGVKPLNNSQKFALEALLAPSSEIPLVILKGPAGTAKTFLSCAAGLHGVIEKSEYRKMLIMRPNIKFDEDIGYLKGDEMDKIRPLIRPCLDNLEALLSNIKDTAEEAASKVDYVFEKGWVTAEALAYVRGRSIANTYILVDEAQNSTPQQMLGILTRAGLNSKIVICGDPDQIDNPRVDRQNNGLVYAADRMKGSPTCAQITFSEEECVRSPLAKEAAKLLK